MQEMDQFSGTNTSKAQGKRQKFVSSSSSMEKWLALFEKVLQCALRGVKPSSSSAVSESNMVEDMWKVHGLYMSHLYFLNYSWNLESSYEQ